MLTVSRLYVSTGCPRISPILYFWGVAWAQQLPKFTSGMTEGMLQKWWDLVGSIPSKNGDLPSTMSMAHFTWDGIYGMQLYTTSKRSDSNKSNLPPLTIEYIV
jgi:hypothetical protein